MYNNTNLIVLFVNNTPDNQIYIYNNVKKDNTHTKCFLHLQLNYVWNKSKFSTNRCFVMFNIFFCSILETVEKVTSPNKKLPVSDWYFKNW